MPPNAPFDMTTTVSPDRASATMRSTMRSTSGGVCASRPSARTAVATAPTSSRSESAISGRPTGARIATSAAANALAYSSWCRRRDAVALRVRELPLHARLHAERELPDPEPPGAGHGDHEREPLGVGEQVVGRRELVEASAAVVLRRAEAP